MSLSTEQYLALSSLAYSSLPPDLTSGGVSTTIGQLIAGKQIDGYYRENDSIASELRPLSSLSRWALINAQTTPSGMSAIAVQNL